MIATIVERYREVWTAISAVGPDDGSRFPSEELTIARKAVQQAIDETFTKYGGELPSSDKAVREEADEGG